MAFWKKSDDPWDQKPNKQKSSVAWWEDAPEQTDAPEEEALTPEQQRQKKKERWWGEPGVRRKRKYLWWKSRWKLSKTLRKSEKLPLVR